MIRRLTPLFLFLPVVLSCSTGESSDTSTEYDSTSISSLKSQYGSFAISREDGKSSKAKFDSSTNTYTIPVEETKAQYVLKGYCDAHFVIDNSNSVNEFKGVQIKLNRACLVSNDSTPVINYTLQSKNIQITAKKNTANKIISLSDASAIESAYNIEFDGNGTLELYSTKSDADGNGGHTAVASEGIYLYDTVTLNIRSGHDGLHADEIRTFSPDDINSVYSGKCTFTSVVSQAIEGTTKKCGGSIALTGGTFVINSCDSVFKADLTLNIGTKVSITATNVKSNPIVRQDKNDLEDGVTLSSLIVTVDGSFTSNGSEVSSQVIE